MKILDRFKSFLSAGKQSTTSISQDNLFTSLNSSNFQQNIGFVNLCVRIRADNVSMAKLILENQQGDQIDDNAFLRLINKPNKSLNLADWLYIASANLDLHGNSYWLKLRNRGEIRELHYLNPLSMQIDYDGAYLPLKYKYFAIGGIREFDPADIIHIKRIDPDAIYKGKSIISAMQDIISLDKLSQQRHQAVLKNSANLSGILTTANPNIKREDLDALKEDWYSTYAGSMQSGKTLISAQDLKYTPLSLNPKDMELLQSRIFSRETILQMFQVSDALIGVQASANRNTAEVAQLIFIMHTISPIVRLIVSSLQNQLLDDFDNNLILSFEDLTPADKQFRLEQQTRQVNTIKTINETRAELGLSEVEGGDVIYNNLGQAPLSAFKNYDRAVEVGDYNVEG